MICRKKNLKQIGTFGSVLLNRVFEWVRHTLYLPLTSLPQVSYSLWRRYWELLKKYFNMEDRVPYNSKRRNYRSKQKDVINMTTINPNNKHIREVQLNNSDFINVRTSKLVELENILYVTHTNGPVKLKVKISADFNEVPEKYHEIFLNVITSKYLGSVSFGENPFSECSPMKKRKWYEFWKEKYYV